MLFIVISIFLYFQQCIAKKKSWQCISSPACFVKMKAWFVRILGYLGNHLKCYDQLRLDAGFRCSRSGDFITVSVVQLWLNVIDEQKWGFGRVMSRLAANPHLMRGGPEALLPSRLRRPDMWQLNVQHYHCHIHFPIRTWDMLFFPLYFSFFFVPAPMLSSYLKNNPCFLSPVVCVCFFFCPNQAKFLHECKSMQFRATKCPRQKWHTESSEWFTAT